MFVRIASAAILLISMATSTYAAMTIYGTRIIFPGNEKEQNVRTNNKGDKPAFVQVWVDDGNLNADVNTMQVPFVVTPPVYRIEPKKGQSVRLIYNGMTLPQDKESVFWFNMLEVPPVQKQAQDIDRLELAFRTRIKIFYRPAGLDSDSVKEIGKLKWERLANSNGIKIINSTPYYFSFERIFGTAAGKSAELNSDMVGPFSDKVFTFKDTTTSLANIAEINFRLINDYGAVVEGTVDLIGNKGTKLKK